MTEEHEPDLDPKVEAIIEAAKGGESRDEIADRFGVTPTTISRWIKAAGVRSPWPQGWRRHHADEQRRHV